MGVKTWGDTKPFVAKSPRKYCLNDIRIKLNNLKKRFGAYQVDNEIAFQRQYTNNEIDYLNMAYYALKSRFCRIHMWRYGVVNKIDYIPRKSYNPWDDYDDYDKYSWTITSATNTSTSATYYATYFNTL